MSVDRAADARPANGDAFAATSPAAVASRDAAASREAVAVFATLVAERCCDAADCAEAAASLARAAATLRSAEDDIEGAAGKTAATRETAALEAEASTGSATAASCPAAAVFAAALPAPCVASAAFAAASSIAGMTVAAVAPTSAPAPFATLNVGSSRSSSTLACTEAEAVSPAFAARVTRRAGFASCPSSAGSPPSASPTAASTSAGNSKPLSVPCRTSMVMASSVARVGSSGNRSSVLSSRATSLSCASRCAERAARASLFSVSVETVAVRCFVERERGARVFGDAAESAIGKGAVVVAVRQRSPAAGRRCKMPSSFFETSLSHGRTQAPTGIHVSACAARAPALSGRQNLVYPWTRTGTHYRARLPVIAVWPCRRPVRRPFLSVSTRSMNTSASSATLAAELREHFAQVVLPLWRGPGFNAALNLPYEAVDSAHRPLPVVRYRAMACARQLFVFSQAGDAAHADTLFDALLSHFHDTLNGGWFFSVNAEGAPLDTSKDLYTHAFIVFACAEYFVRSGNQDALDVMYDTSALITERFAHARDGLLNASLDADFSTVTGTPLQNPLMHLTEAWLAAREATQDGAFGDALTRLVEVVARNFMHQPTGCIAELPLGSDDNRLEPGHQFEWFYLVRRAAGLLGTSGLDEALTRAFSFA